MPEQRFTSVWTRETKPRRAQQGLSREQIVRATVELLDAEGMEALSMRKLGAKLGAGATSLYWHVANKNELLELAMDEVFGAVRIPASESWREVVEQRGLGAARRDHGPPLVHLRAGLAPRARPQRA